MKEKILISLLAIALVSGCSSFSVPGVPGLSTGTNVANNLGLGITSLTVQPSTVFSRSTARLEMDAQNTGGTTVSNTSSLVYITGSNINLGDTSGKYWYGKSAGNDRANIRHFSKSMTPPNVVTGIPANTERVIWNLVAPNLTQGQTRQDSFIVRVYSNYASGVNGNIWVYTDAEAQATKSAGRDLETSSFTSVSGPIDVSVMLSPDPVVLFSGDNSFTFSITLTNGATGTVYKNTSITYSSATSSNLALDADTQLNWVSVSADSPSTLGITECTGDQQIFGGKSLTLVCTATITGTVPSFQSYPVNILVNYGYYTESQTSVTIQGK